MVRFLRLVRSGPKAAARPRGFLLRQRLPRRTAANQALAKRENQGNLAPAKPGGRFFVLLTIYYQILRVSREFIFARCWLRRGFLWCGESEVFSARRQKQILRLTTPRLKCAWGPFRSG
jgi:hypothetical protein